MKRALAGTMFMSLLLLVYIGLTFQLAIRLIGTGEGIAVAMGIALFVIPVVGVWALTRELMFGVQSQRLVRRLDAEGGLPVDDLPHRPSGRPVRAAADAAFPRYAAAVERAPNDWRARLRLGLAYDASGDRRRARAEVRRAIRDERALRRKSAHRVE